MTALLRALPWRTVTLAIDDGPTDLTPQLLDHLERGGHRAVLFVLGCNVAGREPVLVDAVRRGFALGNHSFGHPYFSRLGLAEARTELETTEALIEGVYQQAGAPRPGKWFRFPYLDTGEDGAKALQGLLRDMGFQRPRAVGRRLAAWDRPRLDWATTLDTRDWALPGEAAVCAALGRARPGDVIECHDKLETVTPYAALLADELTARSLRAVVPGQGWRS
jgi:peptidoglycan/xylan/chitin deacetylase (PgdA/CDA1 family)